MAKPPEPAMDKALLKRLLVQSSEAPVKCAFGITKDGGQLLVDKIKNPKVLEKDLVKLFPDIASTRYGEATVPESDPQLVRIVVNRAVSGVAKKLAKVLKGTGFKRIEIMLEDGSLSEGAADEEEGEAGKPAEAAAPGADAVASARQTLGDAVKRIMAAKLTPEEKAKLAGDAKAAMAALAGGDVAGALRLIAPIGTRLDVLEAGPTGQGTPTGQGAPAGQGAPSETGGAQAAAAVPAGTVMLGKAKLAWRATRTKVDSQVDTLKKAVETAYKTRGLAGAVLPALDKKVGAVLQRLSEELEDDLDAVINAKDESERQRLVGVVKSRMAKCQALLDGPEVAKLDDNPFAKLDIRKTMSATLTGLAAAIR